MKQHPHPQPGSSVTAPLKAVPVVVQPLRSPVSKPGLDRVVSLALAGSDIRGDVSPRHIVSARSRRTMPRLVVGCAGERDRIRTSVVGVG